MTELPSNPLHDFSGHGRLFPLPDSVFFPSVVHPLHVFESRYLEMLLNAMEDDNLIVMGVLQPGWEPDYYGRPPVESAVCVGVILSHEKQTDGKYNILLRGQARGRVTRELPPSRSYREVEVELLEDTMHDWNPKHIARQRRHLFQVCQPVFQQHQEVLDSLYRLEEVEMPLGQLADLISHIVPLSLATKLALLAEPNVPDRVGRLIQELESLSAPQIFRGPDPFPPDFSLN